MNFQQLRSVREATRHNYNLTEVAAVLHTSQPAISRQIRELEEELGLEIFTRAGKRLTGLTTPGKALLPIIDRLLLEARNLRNAGRQFQEKDTGMLFVAATHSQARYALPAVVRDFRQMYPGVTLHLRQGSPQQIADMLLRDEADIGVATEALANYEQLVTLPGYRWTHSIIVPPGHPLLAYSQDSTRLTLEALVHYPIITYEQGFTGRAHIDQAFAQAGLQPEIVLTAMDADVIKTYVELGMGIGIVAAIAFDPERDRLLHALDARHLFAVNLTRIAMRRGVWLRDYAFRFIESFVPTLTPDLVRQQLLAGSEAVLANEG